MQPRAQNVILMTKGQNTRQNIGTVSQKGRDKRPINIWSQMDWAETLTFLVGSFSCYYIQNGSEADHRYVDID